MNTTLNEIRKYHPCVQGWEKLLKSLGKTQTDDEPLSFKYLLDVLGIKDAIWCLRALEYKDTCLFQEDVSGRNTADAYAYNNAYDNASYAANVYANACAYAAAAYANASYADAERNNARDKKWKEIEQLFIKHFCEEYS